MKNEGQRRERSPSKAETPRHPPMRSATCRPSQSLAEGVWGTSMSPNGGLGKPPAANLAEQTINIHSRLVKAITHPIQM
jgi:hypothetical protein